MNTSFVTKTFGALALLASSASMAATVTVVPSTLAPTVGNQFTLTITSDVGNTAAATMRLAFDATKVSFVSGAMPAAGPFSVGAGGSFVKNSPASQTPTVFDIITNTATLASPGTYDAVILTFAAIAPGAANIVVDDDGGGCCLWADATTADYIPVTYTQANVVVASAVPVPAPAWLIAPAVLAAGRFSRRRKAA